MAVYAACVYHMDLAVGRLVDGLRERGVLDNTLLLFMSDNGGNAESGPDGRTNGDPSTATSAWYCGESWANLQNTPFRRYKHFNHEGGISSPLIAHWPAGIAARGEWRTTPGHLIDIMATVADVGRAPYPTQFNGHSILPMEGRSLAPIFSSSPPHSVSPSSATDRALFWEHEGNAAVRVGDWKLVRFHRGGAWELYNLATDRTELHDLASTQPARAAALAAQWEAWAQRAHVKPAPADDPANAGKAKGKNKAKKNSRD
jgi:arylsulfatase